MLDWYSCQICYPLTDIIISIIINGISILPSVCITCEALPVEVLRNAPFILNHLSMYM